MEGKLSATLSEKPVTEQDAQGGSDRSLHVAFQQMVIIGVDQMECNFDEACGLHEMYSNFQSEIPKRQDLSCYDLNTSVLVSKGHVVKERD